MMKATPPTQKVYVAIDIEKGGDSPVAHPLLAIGVCVGTGASVAEKRTWCLKAFPGQAMEPRCEDEFWSHHQDLLERIASEAVEPLVGLTDFNDWLAGLHARHAPAEIELLSNNPAYDIGQLDYALCSRGVRGWPVRALGDGEYRCISDPSEMVKGQGAKAIVNAWAAKRATHDHWPENDAEFIYWQYVGACRVRDQLAAGTCLADVALGD